METDVEGQAAFRSNNKEKKDPGDSEDVILHNTQHPLSGSSSGPTDRRRTPSKHKTFV